MTSRLRRLRSGDRPRQVGGIRGRRSRRPARGLLVPKVPGQGLVVPEVPGGGCDEGAPHLVVGAPSGMVVRRRPTLPPRPRGSTIGAERLSFRVRNGTGRFPLAMTAVTL